MRIKLSKRLIITAMLLLFVALPLLFACSADDSDISGSMQEPVDTPKSPVPPEDEFNVVISEYDFDDGYDESENENSSENENGNGINAEAPDEYFEIYSIEGTADSLSDAVWERMQTWRSNASILADNYRGVVITNMNPSERVVYLTFDDGPDSVNTVSVINTLLEYDVSATFFFTGENIRRHGDVVMLAHEAGFSLGLHGYSHTSFHELTAEEIISELNENNDLLEAITGERSKIVRPPYGAVESSEIETINGMDLSIYLWSLDTLDWAQSDANEILRNIKENIRPGDIILMHAFSGQRLVPEILPAIIEFLRDEGFEMRALP